MMYYTTQKSFMEALVNAGVSKEIINEFIEFGEELENLGIDESGLRGLDPDTGECIMGFGKKLQRIRINIYFDYDYANDIERYHGFINGSQHHIEKDSLDKVIEELIK